MNGQHLINSSGSGNGTPTPPSNSSYPASLSSQSSRDPSPHSHELGVTSQYGYSANYDQKSSPNLLVNNFSNMSMDPAKQQQHRLPGNYNTAQKTLQHERFSNISSVRSQSRGLMNHTGSPDISCNSTAALPSPLIISENKYNVTSTQNSSYASSTMFAGSQNNNPHQSSSRNQIQSNNSTFNLMPKQNDYRHVISSADSNAGDVVNSKYRLPSNPPVAASSTDSVVHNIPSSASPLANVSLNSLSPTLSGQTKEEQQNSSVNLMTRYDSGATNKLHYLPISSADSEPSRTKEGVILSSNSVSQNAVNDSMKISDLSSLPRVSSPQHSSLSGTDQSSSLPPATNPVKSSVLDNPSNHQISLASSQNLFPSTASSATYTLSPSNQQPLPQNQPTQPLTSAPSRNKEERLANSIAFGDQLGKPVGLESKQPNLISYSSPTQQQPQQSVYSQPYPSAGQIRPNNWSANQNFGQFSQNKNPVSSVNNVIQPQSVNVSTPQNIQPSYPVSTDLSQSSNFSHLNDFQKDLSSHPPTSMSNTMQSKKFGMPSQMNLSQRVHPSNISGHAVPPPPTSMSQQQPPVAQQFAGVGPHQSMPPTSSGFYQKKLPSGVGSPQLPPIVGSHPQMPPSSLGSPRQEPLTASGPIQQIPPSSLGMQPQMPLPPSSMQYQQTLPPGHHVKNPQYPQQNQLPQHPPLPNQYPQYPQQNNVVQSQPMGVGAPYGMNRYPMPHTHGGAGVDTLSNQLRGASVTQDGFSRLWGMDTYDLLKTRDLLPKERVETPSIRLNPELFDAANCSPELFRCTLTKIPETKSLLDKSRLPLGVLIHPFKDLTQLSVIQCSTIVRCRACRTYINPFVYFVDNKRWKCNLCFRVNELPDEFQFDPMSKTYGDPSRRPEIKSATIEFIAPSEYMVRPPQPAIYLFLFDVSRLGTESGYLEVVCSILLDELDNLPGDARTSIGFITYDSSVHFYSLADGLSQPHQMVVVDIDDMFLPCPENLLVNLSECHDLIKDLLTQLPKQYAESYNTESALGAALQAAYKLLAPTGGRVTVFQSRLPSIGPGALVAREDPSQRASDTVPHLNPSTDFYKKLALDCSSQQIAVDLFLVNLQYVDVATLSGVSRFSGGCIYHFPLFRAVNSFHVNSLKRTFQRYLTRKIGFESVMRLRCTRGLSIHTFHGNFFVRSTDLLSLPNVNPDAGFGMQVSIEESLSELQNVCFQAALLYTSSKGERRIRVHTLCLPIATNLSEILNAADQYCIIGLLAKMAVDRSIESSLTDAREAFINVVADILSAFKLTQNAGPSGCLLSPKSLRLVPLFILALLKSVAFRTGQSTRLDDRVFAMCQMKCLPLSLLLQSIYPDLYPVHNLEQQAHMDSGDENPTIVPPQRLHLSSEKIDSHGVYVLDNGTMIFIYVGHNINPSLCQALFGVPHFTALPQDMYELPELTTPENERLREFVFLLQSEKAYDACIQIIRDDSQNRVKFLEHLIEDKNEAGTSYYEFLQRIKVLVK